MKQAQPRPKNYLNFPARPPTFIIPNSEHPLLNFSTLPQFNLNDAWLAHAVHVTLDR